MSLDRLSLRNGLLAKLRDLEGHIPRLACVGKAPGEHGIVKLFFQIAVEVGLFHGGFRVSQSALSSSGSREINLQLPAERERDLLQRDHAPCPS
jgi:hypothetical protein